MKIPRFMKEFASYMHKEIESHDLMVDEVKAKWHKDIEYALKAYSRGMITVSEAMRMIDGMY